MTYREHLTTLKQQVIAKLSMHLQAEQETLKKGGGLLNNTRATDTYKEWQEAQTTYNNFLSLIINVGSLDEQMPSTQETQRRI